MKNIVRLPLYLLLALFVVILVAVYIYYFTTLPEAEINNYLRSFAGNKLGLDISIQRVNRDIWDHLVLEGVEITAQNDPQAQLAYISRLELEYDFNDVLRGKYDFTRLWIDSLAAGTPGQFKALIPAGSRAGQSKPSHFSLRVDDLTINFVKLALGGDDVIIADSLRCGFAIDKGNLSAHVDNLSARWPARKTELGSLTGRLTSVDGTYKIDSVTMVLGSSNILVSGSLGKSLTKDLDLSFDANPLNFDDLNRIVGAHSKGELTASGTLKGSWNDFSGEATINGAFFERPLESVDISYSFAHGRIKFDSIRGDIFKAAFDGSGELDFNSKPPKYAYYGTVKHLDLRQIGPELKTDFTGGVHLEGSGFNSADLSMSIDGNLDSVRVETYYFDKISGQVRLDLKSIKFLPGFQGRYKNTYVTASGNLEYQGDLDITGSARFDDLRDFRGQLFIKELGGRGKADFHATGKTADFAINGSFESDSCWTYGLQAESLSIYADLKSFISHPVGIVTSKWSGGLLYSVPTDSGYFEASLSGERVFLDSVSVVGPQGSLALHGRYDGTSVPPIFYADTLHGDFSGNSFFSIKPVILDLRENETEFEQFIMGLETGQIQVTGTASIDLVLNLDVRASDFQIGPLVAQFYKDKELRGIWQGDARIRGAFDNPEIDFDLKIDSLTINQVPLGDLDARLTYGSGYLRTDSTHLKSEYGDYYFSGDLPVNLSFGEVANRLPDQPINLRMAASGSRLLLSEVFIPTIERFETDFVVEMSLGGTYAQPTITGWGNINNGELKVLDLVNPLTDIRAYFRMNNGTIFIDSAFAFAPGGGEWIKGLEELIPRRKGEKPDSHIKASGTMRLVTLGNFEYDIDVIGKNFFFISDSYDVRGLADLDLRVVGETPPTVMGDINLKRLEVRDEFDSFIPPDYDPNLVVEDSTLWNLDLDISAVNNLWIKNSDVDGEMKGNLHVERQLGLISILGSLDFLRGNYYLPGWNFKIESGTMQFKNVAIVNPDINFLISTRLHNPENGAGTTNIDMQITGTLLEPKIGVASGSQVSNEDLLKYLLTGSQVNPLGTTQTNFSQTVLQSLTSTLPSIIPGFRGGGIFEELSLVPTEKGTELSLAKYISRSLYVRYSQRLSVDPGRTIGVEYYLNDNVSLNVTRGVQGTQKYEGISFDLNLNFEY